MLLQTEYRGRSAIVVVAPSFVSMRSWWSMKSNWTSKALAP